MSKKSVRPATRPQSSPRQAAADCINRALEKSDIAEICHARYRPRGGEAVPDAGKPGIQGDQTMQTAARVNLPLGKVYPAALSRPRSSSLRNVDPCG